MLTRSWTVAVLLLLTAACAPALAAPVTVNLRVEGASTTIYEADVTTDAKTLTKDASGPHPCDGTNGGANPAPGPTMTSALDDGAIAGGFTWDGTWFGGFEDFGIDRVGPDAATSSQFWGYALNFKATQVGGCQQQVAAGDQVLFGYDFFSKAHLLRLTGPARAATDETVTVRVSDGGDDSPIAGATVDGVLTDGDGTASLKYDSGGVRRLKAERADSLRSNALEVCVYVRGSGDCGTEPAPPPASPEAPETPAAPPPAAPPAPRDSVAPRPTITSLTPGRRYRRGPRLLEGRVEEAGGIHQVYLRLVRQGDEGLCRWFSARREAFTRLVPCRRARFFRVGDRSSWSYLLPERLARGRYLLEVKVLDRALNAGRTELYFAVR